MYPCTCALMLALMKPSSVATRSSTRGTSCGCTVVTRTSGAGGAACGALREQLETSKTQTEAAPTARNGCILIYGCVAPNCRARMREQVLSLSGDSDKSVRRSSDFLDDFCDL